MTERRTLVWSVIAVLVVLAAAVPMLGGAASEPSPPVIVERSFTGTTADSHHAVAVTVTVAPTEDTGPINNTVLTIRASDQAFIAPESVSTTETAGGAQVITEREGAPATFDIGRLEPGETASVSLRVYAKAVLPSGDSLAVVATETQFVRTQRVASDERVVAPSVKASEASYATEPALPPVVSGGLGAGVATALTLAVALVYRRRERATLRGRLRAAHAEATSLSAQEAIEDVLARLGGSVSTEETALDADATSDEDDDTLALDFDE